MKVLDMLQLSQILNTQNISPFWEIGCKAISSSKDYEMYEAIRLLLVKEAEGTPQSHH
jgi:hypothetical protein